jgi:hypothetical protein
MNLNFRQSWLMESLQRMHATEEQKVRLKVGKLNL